MRLFRLREGLNGANDEDDLQLSNGGKSLPRGEGLTAKGAEGGTIKRHESLRRGEEVAARCDPSDAGTSSHGNAAVLELGGAVPGEGALGGTVREAQRVEDLVARLRAHALHGLDTHNGASAARRRGGDVHGGREAGRRERQQREHDALVCARHGVAAAVRFGWVSTRPGREGRRGAAFTDGFVNYRARAVTPPTQGRTLKTFFITDRRMPVWSLALLVAAWAADAPVGAPATEVTRRQLEADDLAATASESLPVPNYSGLLKQVERRLDRMYKKASKARSRVSEAERREQELLSRDDTTDAQLEALPDLSELRLAADAQQQELSALLTLSEELRAHKGSRDASDAVYVAMARVASELGLGDTAPPPPPKKEKKPKGVKQSEPRLPYVIYDCAGGVEIRVGRKAEDNDELSTNQEYRDDDDYWLHAADCAGSHVVIRSDTLPNKEALSAEVEMDGAVLAANFSKAAKIGTVKVHLVRARQVSKPRGAKPGLVHLSGKIKTIKVWTNPSPLHPYPPPTPPPPSPPPSPITYPRTHPPPLPSTTTLHPPPPSRWTGERSSRDWNGCSVGGMPQGTEGAGCASCRRASCRRASCRRASFRRASSRRASFRRASFRRASFRRASFRLLLH